MSIREDLLRLSDKEYAVFQQKITPNVDPNTFIGIRLPILREYAKTIKNADEFLLDLPHKYYDENILHSILLTKCKDYDKCISYVESFLPYIDNWAVNDTLNPKVFKKNKKDLLIHIEKWIKSTHEYTVRFGIYMLMKFYLDEDFDIKYLDMVASIRSELYYINMMVAWYFAEGLTKKWDSTIKYIEDKKLSKWCHNKAIQKAVESFRITEEQKSYLKSLRIK